MDIVSLTAYVEQIKSGCSMPDMLDFGRKLIAQQTREYLDFHYELLGRKDIHQLLYDFVCRKFRERGTVGEDYLLQRLEVEPDGPTRATALQILGTFKFSQGKRLETTAAYARQFLGSADTTMRCRALWVLGWLGNAADMEGLAVRLHEDTEEENRGWAAAAMMQIHAQRPEVAATALGHLKQALEQEQDARALTNILVAIQEISGHQLGLDASAQEQPEPVKIAWALQQARGLLSR